MPSRNLWGTAFLFSGILSIMIFLSIGDIYRIPSENRTIITLSCEPSIIKYCYFPSDIRYEAWIYRKLDFFKDIITLTFPYKAKYIKECIYVFLIIGIFFILCTVNLFNKNKKPEKISKLIILQVISICFLYMYIYQGEIFVSSGTEVTIVDYKHPTLQKKCVFICQEEGEKANILYDNFINSYTEKIIRTDEYGDIHESQYMIYTALILSIYFFAKILFVTAHRATRKDK